VMKADQSLCGVGVHGVSLAGVCIYRLCPPVYTCQAHFENSLGRVA
jgi:hypothetical protein